MAYSKKLQRYIRKVFQTEDIAQTMKDLKNHPERCEAFPGQFLDFLDLLEAHIEESEKKIAMANHSLEVSSKELFESNTHLIKKNHQVKTIVDGLGQAVLLFNREGVCLPIHSENCHEFLGMSPSSKTIEEVLRFEPKQVEKIKDWLEILFNETIEFDDVVELMPNRLSNDQGKDISIKMKPIRNDENKVQEVLVVLNDNTSTKKQEEKIKEQHIFSQKILSIVSNKEEFSNFLIMAQKTISDLLKFDPKKEELCIEIKRMLHNLKSVSGSFFIFDFKSLIHEVEAAISESPIQFNQEKVNWQARMQAAFTHLSSTIEALLGREFVKSADYRHIKIEDIHKFETLLSQEAPKLSQSYNDLIAKVSLKRYCNRYSALLVYTARSLNKNIKPLKLEIDESIKVKLETVENFLLSLTHIFTNAVDHGIETAEERQLNNKSIEGSISLRVESHTKNGKNWLKFEIQDDGKGISIKDIQALLIKKGILKESENISDSDCIDLFLKSEVSSKSSVSEFSGRGIGLSAAYYEVKKLGGSFEFNSMPGKGTTLVFNIPSIE